MIAHRGYNPIEVILGGEQLRIAVEINRNYKIATLIRDFIKVKRHRIDAVIEVVNRKDQFMLILTFRLAQLPVQGQIEPVIIGKPIVVTFCINGHLVIIIIIESGRGRKGSPGHIDKVAAQRKSWMKGP